MIEVETGEFETFWACAAPDMLGRTTDLTYRALKASGSMLSSFTASRQIVRCASGLRPLVHSAPLPNPFCGQTFASNSPHALSGLPNEAMQGLFETPVRAYLGAPVPLASGQATGVLCVVDTEARDWSNSDRERIVELAACLGNQVELSGLGLAITKGLVESLDGRVGIVGDRDRGSTFWFEIPLVAGRSTLDATSAAASTAPASDTDRSPRRLRILVADDLDLNRKLIADMLQIEDHVVDCVEDGAAAVKAASERNYDLILMDMIMPGVDGLAATREIRKLPAPAGRTPIIALTANSFREQLDSCLAAGMDATLTKPMSLDALAAAVASWTRKRRKAA